MLALVRAVYFDTSVLRTIPFCRVAQSLEPLRRISTSSRVALFTPELCVRELVGYHSRTVAEQQSKLKAAAGRLRTYTSSPTEAPLLPCMNNDEIAGRVKADLEAAGIGIVPTPPIELSALVDQAIERRPPFDDSGRGFRDALILEAVCAHAREYSGHIAVLATLDKDFAVAELSKRGEDIGVCLKRASDPKTVADLISTEMMAAMETYHVQQAERVIELVRKNPDAFFSDLRAKLVPSEDFLLRGARFATRDSPPPKGDPFGLQFSTLRRIEAFRFGQLTAGSAFQAVLAERETGREYVGLSVEAEFDIVVESPARLFEYTRYTLPTDSEPGEVLRPSYDRHETRISISRTIPCTVSVISEDDEFTDLRVETCNA